MNAVTSIKQKLKKAKGKVGAAVATAGAVVATSADTVFAALDLSDTGPIATAIEQGKTDYEAIFGMLLAAIVVFWALSRLKTVFFEKKGS
jgi:hypothetical protein